MTHRTIEMAARESGLTAHTLRYYEREGIIPPVRRGGNGHRNYTDTDLKWIEYASCLRKLGFSVREIRRYVSLYQKGDAAMVERVALLVAHKEAVDRQLEILERTSAELEGKIALYRSRIRKR